MMQNVFIDTDIGPDCDDAGALALLCDFCSKGFARLLGVSHCTGSPYGVPTVSAILQAFGLNAPIGTCPDTRFLNEAKYISYTPHIAGSFPHDYPPEVPQPDALTVFRDCLRSAEDASVTVIGIGPQINLAAYLKDPETLELIRRKVTCLVTMAGSFENDSEKAEWNILMDIPAAGYVADNWPGPVIYCPFELADKCRTGACLRNYSRNPVAMAYRVFCGESCLRPSWDLATVSYAVLGPQEIFLRTTPGRVHVDAEGHTLYSPDDGGNRSYLVSKAGESALTERIEAQLTAACVTMESVSDGK